MFCIIVFIRFVLLCGIKRFKYLFNFIMVIVVLCDVFLIIFMLFFLILVLSKFFFIIFISVIFEFIVLDLFCKRILFFVFKYKMVVLIVIFGFVL